MQGVQESESVCTDFCARVHTLLKKCAHKMHTKRFLEQINIKLSQKEKCQNAGIKIKSRKCGQFKP